MATQAETVIGIGAICAMWEILRLNEKPSKPLVKQGFEQEHQMAEKQTDPWSPAAHHGIARDTIKKPWENKLSAHGRTGGDGDLYRIHFRDL